MKIIILNNINDFNTLNERINLFLSQNIENYNAQIWCNSLYNYNETLIACQVSDDNEIVNNLIYESLTEAERAAIVDLSPNFYRVWDMEIKNFRLVVNNKKQLEHILNSTDLGQLFVSIRADYTEQTIITDNYTFIYLANIDEQYRPLLEKYPDTIEIQSK